MSITKIDHVASIHRYIKDVLSGKIVACKYVKLACQRHLDDLARAEREDPDFPYYFDPEKVNRLCRFVELMVHCEGPLAGKPIHLEPWQKFAYILQEGWLKRGSGFRRFTESIVFVPRKNGKSVLQAAIGLYNLCCQGIGEQVFCLANSKQQSGMIFNSVISMAELNPKFRDSFGLILQKERVYCTKTRSNYIPLVAKPKDGTNPTYCSVDEIHQASTDEGYSAVKTGMGARPSPLLSIISTAGFNTSGIGKQRWDALVKVLEGAVRDDSLFGVIYTIDEDDDWATPAAYIKANPNLNISVYEDFLKSQLAEAIRNPAAQNAYKCKHLNVWSNAATAFISYLPWKACEAPEDLKLEDFRGEDCWIGIDLASKRDILAVSFIFYRDNKYYLFVKNYINEETAMLPENERYREFHARGEMIITPGASTDQMAVMASLFGQNERARLARSEEWAGYFTASQEDEGWEDMFNIRGIYYDPRESGLLMQMIGNHSPVPCIEMPQSPSVFSEPIKLFEGLYLDGRLIHEKNSCLDWQASNVQLKNTLSKSYFFTKASQENKIDAMVASVMALAGAARDIGEGSEPEIFLL